MPGRVEEWRAERSRRRAERAARLKVVVANRTFTREPGRIDALASRAVAKAVGPAPRELDPDLGHED